ncbi:CLUMA_CG000130, isoform A [Clunio marinus]|uniref:CLUMA_CG000130, isoform A n=1 Tax=Clunio marinus TaxID=568069 RepID=A0A1J1HIL1_9DIPT|nr:CLUMA_CG000130, isoform A [Clunio marinus]
MLLSTKIFRFSRYLSTTTRVWSQQLKSEEKVKDSGKIHQKEKDPNIIFHKPLNINFTKLPLKSKELSKLIFLEIKKTLKRQDQIIVEGNQLIKEAIQSNIKLNYLLFSHVDKITDIVNVMGTNTKHVNFLKAPQHDLTFYSVLTTCPGVIGIFDKPKEIQPKTNPLPITIICDNLREPNNLGSVIRLANALPVTKVLLPKGNADPWDVKAIRGSSGSIFYIPTEHSLEWKQIEEDQTIDDSIILIADNNASKYPSNSILCYDKIPKELIENKQIYVLLGGETHGISEEAKDFAFKRNWKVIHIPIDSIVDSLNTSNALAIILFELRRMLSNSY